MYRRMKGRAVMKKTMKRTSFLSFAGLRDCIDRCKSDPMYNSVLIYVTFSGKGRS